MRGDIVHDSERSGGIQRLFVIEQLTMPLIRLPPVICQIIRVVDDLPYDARIS